ncbi:MAG: putative glycoside hydrolase [Bacillota bacterium]
MSEPVIQPRRRFPAPGPLIAVLVLLLLLGGAAVYFSCDNRAIIAFPGNPAAPEEPEVGGNPGLTEPPFWPEPPQIPRPEFVKGIYVNVLEQPLSEAFFTQLVELIDNTELNAVVIDLKDDRGRLTYSRTRVPWANSAGAPDQYIDHPVELIARLSENGIYPIARIVAFKDALMAEHRPDLAALNSRGEPWRYGADSWLDPYNKHVWKYVVALAREAAELGFREIQFDYVRFPSDGNLNDIYYPASDGSPYHEVIPAFLRYARASLAEYDVELSADIFGLVTYDPGDQGIGQHLESIAATVDLVCPMIYPSHYGAGNLGLENPDAAPYDTVYRSLQVAVNRLEQAGLETTIRPWLQAFTINHLYGAAEVRAQIQAAEDLGIHEFLLWNNGNYYNAAALRPADK